jgi:hypothetical protein
MSSLFKNADEETQAVVIGAAVALHALIAGRNDTVTLPTTHHQLVSEAFALSREFWKRAKQEVGP